MNKLEEYLARLLNGHLSCDARLAKKWQIKPKLPVLTLDVSQPPRRVAYTPEYKVDGSLERHVYYEAKINVNIWCNKEEERGILSREVQDLFWMEQNHNTKYCTYNMDGTCSHDEGKCIPQETRGKLVTQCRRSDYNEAYKSISSDCCILAGTLAMDDPFELDDVEEHPPILRSIIPVEATYMERVDYAGIKTGIKE